MSFQPDRGAPDGVLRMDALRPLNSFEEDGIRYFSGTASYATSVDLPALEPGQRLWLDLGQVGDVAEVWLNGEYAGTSWFAPDRVEITDLAQESENRLEVRVANRWINRLIGDVQPGAEPVAKVVSPTYVPDAPLRPSGLIGPVTVLATQ